MLDRDLVVTAIAALLGLAFIWSGVGNLPFAFKLRLPRLLDQRFGRTVARWLLVTLGFALIGLGLFIQWRP